MEKDEKFGSVEGLADRVSEAMPAYQEIGRASCRERV